MNWIIVIFDESRQVYVDGKLLGDTNEVLFIGEDGTYTIDLGEPRDYHPDDVTIPISGTSRENPIEIRFYK